MKNCLLLFFLFNIFFTPGLFADLKWQKTGKKNYPGGYIILKYDARGLSPSEAGRRVRGLRSITISPLDITWKESGTAPLKYIFSNLNENSLFGKLHLDIPNNSALSNKTVKCRVDMVFRSDIRGMKNSEKFEEKQEYLILNVTKSSSGWLKSRNVSFFLLFFVVCLVFFQLRESKREGEVITGKVK
ncbi:hypothetical protein ACFL35_07370 [Candidatus Riflebacteria bacterium]